MAQLLISGLEDGYRSLLIMNKLNIIKNNIISLKNYYSKKISLDNKPTYFWLEPTNHCNLRCIMCPNGAGKIEIEKGYMGYPFYKKIIDEISEYASTITMAVHGESVLHPRFFDMVRYATDKSIKVLLNTNATLIDKKRAELMLDSGVASISFAFDGFDKFVYEKARVGATYEETLENILYFLKLKKEANKKLPYTVLSVLMLGLNDYHEEGKGAFLKQFDGLIDEIRIREVSTWGNTFKETNDFSFRNNLLCYPPCSRLWSTAVITWNGNVLPCVYNANHEYIIGSLREKSFKEIWNSEKMLALRKSMLNESYLQLSPLCENCIVLGTPPICGIPAGIRMTLTDSITNIVGYKFEKFALAAANKIRKGKFSSKTINPIQTNL
tara:strand:- start:368 stop:1516 length:1149 start_codon:yes stop_codon:yes gene_type:complete